MTTIRGRLTSRVRIWGGMALTLAAVAALAQAPSASVSTEMSGSVLIVPLRDQIDRALLFYLRRAFQRAEKDSGVRAVVIDMDTPGGELRATEEIISWMRSLSAIGKPTYTFVNARAQSAGAIICLASDAIYMAPGSRVGSAAPILMNPGSGQIQEVPDDVKEKILSDTRALVRGLAQEKGYLPDLAEAMVDNKVEVTVGDRVICREGQLLNLTAEEAVEIIPPRELPLLATGIVKSIDELLAALNLEKLEQVRIEPHGAEQLARWVTMMAPIFMIVGFIGIYLEMKTPGFGVPGIVGAVALALFLFGHYIAGLAGKEDILLVLIGMVLIMIEVFVLPGFGVCGLLGILALLAGIIMAMIPHLPSVPPLPGLPVSPMTLEPFLNRALINVVITMIVTAAGGYFLAQFLPRTALYSHLVLQSSASVSAGYVGTDIVGNQALVGKHGKTITPLRPAGIAMFGERRVDVVSEGDYIESDEPVVVRRTDGPRIIVTLVPPVEHA